MTQRSERGRGAPRRQARGASSARLPGLLAVLVGVAGVAAAYGLFVGTESGQELDERWSPRPVLAVSPTDGDLVEQLNNVVLGVGVAVLAVAMTAALVRGRPRPAIAAGVLVGGANLTTQALKHGLLDRPDLGYGVVNTLPSGHTAGTTSLLLALVVVAPGPLRRVVVPAGAVGAAIVGVGVIAAGWHRQSDVLAALAVCLAWSGLVGLALARPSDPWSASAQLGPGVAVSLAATVVSAGVGLAYAYGLRPDGITGELAVRALVLAGVGAVGALVVVGGARVLPAMASRHGVPG